MSHIESKSELRIAQLERDSAIADRDSAQARVHKLEAAAQAVVDNCDLPRESYSRVEWGALERLRAALAAKEGK